MFSNNKGFFFSKNSNGTDFIHGCVLVATYQVICIIPHNTVYDFNNKSFLDFYLVWFKQIHVHIYTDTIESSNFEKWFSDDKGCFVAKWTWNSFFHCWLLVAIFFIHVYDSNRQNWTDLVSTDKNLLHLNDLHLTADLLHSKFFHKGEDSCIERQHFSDAGRVVLGIWRLCWGCFHNSSTLWWFNVP